MFASKGIILHLNSKFYQPLKEKTSVLAARKAIKSITAHNDKMCVNWASKDKKFVLDTESSQYNSSGYKEFLLKAAAFLSPAEKFKPYADILKSYAETKFNITPPNRTEQIVQYIDPSTYTDL